MRWVAVMPITALLLVACAAPPPSIQPQGASPIRSPLEPPGGRTELNDLLIIFERSGGLAGIQETWRFYGDGRVIREQRMREAGSAQARVAIEHIERAARHLVEAGFLELADEYMPTNRCCDRFTYRLTLVYEGKVKTVTTMDGAEQPQALAEALRIINELIQQANLTP